MVVNKAPTPSRGGVRRPVLYQLCRAGERFEVGDGPKLLGPHPVVLGRGDPQRTDAGNSVLVDDPWMSTRHAVLAPRGTESARGTRPRDQQQLRYTIEDAGSTNGVIVNGATVQRAALLHGDLIETGRTFFVYVEEGAADPLLTEPFELGAIATWTPSFAARLKELVGKLKEPDHVLLYGSDGSGKGFLARTIHAQSGRTGRFVHLDCRDRKTKRLIVDLFGNEQVAGRLRDADNGTLFIENIDALPVELQQRLASAIAKRQFTSEGRAGRGGGFPLSARVIASQALPVEDAVGRGLLERVLVDALGPLQIGVPGLSQRLPDLGLLLDDCLSRARGAPAITREACRAVLKYPFRQQVKAFARTIEAAASLACTFDPTLPGARGGAIDLMHLPVDVVGASTLRVLLKSPSGSTSERTSELTPLASQTGDDDTGFSDEGPTDPAQQRDAIKAAQAAPAEGATAQLQALPRKQQRPPSMGAADAGQDGGGVDVETLQQALRQANGNVSIASRALGRPRAQVLRWLREFGIDPGIFRS